MTPSKRIQEIKELLATGFFVDNPNGSDVCDEIEFLLSRLEAASAVIEAAKMCERELGYMLSMHPKRRGGLYEEAHEAVKAALSTYEGGGENG